MEDGDFKTEVGASAVCTSQTAVINNPDESSSVGVIQVGLYDTRLEAFRGNTTDTEFSVMGKYISSFIVVSHSFILCCFKQSLT